MHWKELVLKKYYDCPENIGRSLAKELGVPKSTLWDFKQKIISGAVKYIPEEENVSKPKILAFDIETAPVLAHVWSIWNQNVGLNQIMDDWYMLSWSAQWLGEDEVMYDALPNHKTTFEQDPTNDFNILCSLYALLNEADVIIAHNGRRFDVKKVKARLLKWGLRPLSSFRVIDTLDIAKREFALTSNRLDYLATYLELPNKVAHSGHSLWVKCMQGNKEAWETMIKYNKYDVSLLIDVYYKIRAWDSKHPNLAIYYDDHRTRCMCCGSDAIEETGKMVTTNLSMFKEYECLDCGKVGRGSNSVTTKKDRSMFLRNV